MPGHKHGKGMPKELYQNFLKLDLTEIPGLDNLHAAKGVISDAQRLAAIAFGADQTFFLVNGATSGIQVMIMAACRKSDKLIVARDCHKAVINAMILVGVKPVYIYPEYNQEFGITEAISPQAVRKAFEDNPDAVGLFITRPTYYGICSDLQEIESIVHLRNKLLLVDEAHGAHLSFCDRLPKSAMQLNADICVQSAHKTLPAVTQSAFLHVKGSRIDLDRLQYNLRMLSTSSPSYIIMSSLDIARAIMETNGNKLLEGLLEIITDAKHSLKKLTCLKVLEQSMLPLCEYDCTRIVINVSNLGKTGYEIEQLLRCEYGIQVEMSDLYNIVLIATISDDKNDFIKLVAAMESIYNSPKGNTITSGIHISMFNTTQIGIELCDTFNSNNQKVELTEAVGSICGQMIVPYPPGIPLICPGEIFSQEIVDQISMIKSLGGSSTGLGDDMKVDIICVS